MFALGPVLGRLLVTLFGGLFAYIAKYLIVDKAFKIASIVFMLAIIAGILSLFMSCTQGSCSAAIVNAANGYPTFAMGLAIAFNTTTYAAGSTYIVIYVACQLYVVKKRMTGLLLGGA